MYYNLVVAIAIKLHFFNVAHGVLYILHTEYIFNDFSHPSPVIKYVGVFKIWLGCAHFLTDCKHLSVYIILYEDD